MARNIHTLANATDDERRVLAHLAIGRIFGLLQRPYREGDVALYEEARAVLLDVSMAPPPPPSNWALGFREGRSIRSPTDNG